MITLHIEVPYASFRKSYARSLAETYPFPPPATVYGMLLSLVGERFRANHSGVKLALAFARQPRISRTLRRMSGAKYGVSRTPDFIETLCGIDFLCWVDSSQETNGRTLEARLTEAIITPERVNRTGIVSLGLSDDAVDDISLISDLPDWSEKLCQWNGNFQGWHWLNPQNNGQIELPIWVDHVGAFHTRWRRYQFEESPLLIYSEPEEDKFTPIVDPRG
ncbi:CRISPR-associated protein Cas5 [Thermosynechococcaceae cyanobacterium BACA0444]|uniref:CRISPR-associated protein Cas5 n=1 Tax=Pseudocalidococcus azoricus BACA0444 TaxID=2918990 RepID=A0AAE4FTA6_9CYAN|nr:CRISPR-associated protein Cas5 [Pseudocalidococcus azoricus]MDS3860586.1 CRISPR-associated protein Cas5 [Pseudocalidococcus azoricus BACA0444]